MDAAFRAEWQRAGVRSAPAASDLTLARRLSLALVGTIPSLEEIRSLESRSLEKRDALDVSGWWLSRLFADQRYYDYLAERLARAYVGVKDGPFIIYRRRRFVSWLADELAHNRAYDELVRKLIADDGLWTDKPATNFLTVTIVPDNDQGPNERELAARVSRAFLGKRIDCAECHDHPFEPWKQSDFLGLAAFFSQAKQTFTGIRDVPGEFKTKDDHTGVETTVVPTVPFRAELLPATGDLRQRLAVWVTHHENLEFSREAVNRMWALLFGRALVEPIDDLRAKTEIPPALDILAKDFADHGFDLRRLIQLIASTEVFQLDSCADPAIPGHEITEAHEAVWAAFPITRLRPEQVVGGIQQSASLRTLGSQSHIVVQLTQAIAENEFIKRYGDSGEEEFSRQGGTIPQRLLMMNGETVRDRTDNKIATNAATQIGALAPTDARAVETAYLAVLSRRPSPEEAVYFEQRLANTSGTTRADGMEDLYWTLINSTEFSWNH